MSPNCATENAVFATQLNRLNQFNHFISEVATAIVAGNDDFETVWNIANRVYEEHCPPKVRFMTHSGLDQSRRTALSA
jgi:hypothetical protein